MSNLLTVLKDLMLVFLTPPLHYKLNKGHMMWVLNRTCTNTSSEYREVMCEIFQLLVRE